MVESCSSETDWLFRKKVWAVVNDEVVFLEESNIELIADYYGNELTAGYYGNDIWNMNFV